MRPIPVLLAVLLILGASILAAGCTMPGGDGAQPTPAEMETETPMEIETETPMEIETETPMEIETETPVEMETETLPEAGMTAAGVQTGY